MTPSVLSLQNLCFEQIVSNFCRYFRSSCTEDLCLKSQFRFLKKKYSFHILQKLNEENRLKVEYLPFLINKYLKVLDTLWLRNCPWETVTQKFAEIGYNLEEVTFTVFGRQWNEAFSWEEVLCYLPNLKSATFENFCSDRFLLSLSKFCKCVETLNVKHSYGVSDYGLMQLCCKDNDKILHSFHAPIKELTVESTNIGDEGIAYILKNMPSLEKIDYCGLPELLHSMHKCDINAVTKVKPYSLTDLNLLSIDCDAHVFTNIFTVCAFVCPHLKSLACPILQKHHLDLCSQLQELEKLRLDCWQEDPLELNELLTLNGKNLTSLKIRNFCMSLSIITNNCPKLILLEMDNVYLQHNYNDFISVFHNLEKVAIENLLLEPVITEAVTCLLSSTPNLKQLCFNSCERFFTDVKIQILRCCEQCKLKVIDFSNSDVELVLLRDILLNCSTLQTLNLDNCDIIRDYGAMHELKTIATSLPNKPKICIEDAYDDYNDDLMDYSFFFMESKT